jgi:hypothetical protein
MGTPAEAAGASALVSADGRGGKEAGLPGHGVPDVGGRTSPWRGWDVAVRVAEAALVWAVVGAAAREPARLFSYHPTLAVAGVVCAAEAVLVAVELRRYAGPHRRTLTTRHWQWAAAGLALQLAAFAVAYVNKDLHGKRHFVSNHAWYPAAAATTSTTRSPMVHGVVLTLGACEVRGVLRLGTATLVLAVVQTVAGAVLHGWPELVGGRAAAGPLLSVHRVSGHYNALAIAGTVALGLSTGWYARLRPEAWQYVVGASAVAVLATALFVRQEPTMYARAWRAVLRR